LDIIKQYGQIGKQKHYFWPRLLRGKEMNQEDTLKEVISAEAIQERVKELAGELEADYRDMPLILVGILKGAYQFLADLSRNPETTISSTCGMT
jgi:hypothetical protein